VAAVAGEGTKGCAGPNEKRAIVDRMPALLDVTSRAIGKKVWRSPFPTTRRVACFQELVRGDHGKAVQQLKRESSGKGLLVGGVKLPLALSELGLIDEYEFVVQPKLAGHGPTLFEYVQNKVLLTTGWPHSPASPDKRNAPPGS
jgi:riboflavin biosynthesis pyrimidine reductase